MCTYGAWANTAGGCDQKIVAYCNECDMDCCGCCFEINMNEYEGKCPCGKGDFIKIT